MADHHHKANDRIRRENSRLSCAPAGHHACHATHADPLCRRGYALQLRAAYDRALEPTGVPAEIARPARRCDQLGPPLQIGSAENNGVRNSETNMQDAQ